MLVHQAEDSLTCSQEDQPCYTERHTPLNIPFTQSLIADLARWVPRVKALACTILCEAVEICLGCYHGADFPIFLQVPLVLSVGIVGGGRSCHVYRHVCRPDILLAESSSTHYLLHELQTHIMYFPCSASAYAYLRTSDVHFTYTSCTPHVYRVD
jgi:hypothetical protein